MSPPPVERKLTMASRLGEVSGVEQQVLEAVDQNGYPQADRFAIKLAMEEALANAIKHGNQSDPNKSVTVEVHATPDRVAITICDEGRGFEPGDLPDPTLEENLTKPYGRGVMLMRAYMNEVSFNDAGNCVTMVKLRGCPPDQKPDHG